MEKWLKRICIICIIIVIIIGIIDIYNDYILPKKYNSESVGSKITDENEYNMCNNAALKYYLSIRENINNIKYFITAPNRSKAKISTLNDNLSSYSNLTTYNVYKLANNIYKIDYSISYSNKFSMVVKFNKHRNYYTVIYDELYEKGKVG